MSSKLTTSEKFNFFAGATSFIIAGAALFAATDMAIDVLNSPVLETVKNSTDSGMLHSISEMQQSLSNISQSLSNLQMMLAVATGGASLIATSLGVKATGAAIKSITDRLTQGDQPEKTETPKVGRPRSEGMKFSSP